MSAKRTCLAAGSAVAIVGMTIWGLNIWSDALAEPMPTTPTPTVTPESAPQATPESQTFTVSADAVTRPLDRAVTYEVATVTQEAPVVEIVAPAADWRDGYVPCLTPSGDTMTVGCYWDQGDQPYIVTDDGETFLIDEATGERTYVMPGEEPWATVLPDGTLICGLDAKPALDWNERDGWWAYCEPALVDPEAITLFPCAAEDSDNCYWDATKRGNGQGTSFVTIDGTVYYPRGAE